MSYRVIHCGTGHIGSVALRTILDQPDLELVGHYVSSPEKVGRDSGELVGAAANGITATGSWADLLDLNADCLTYFEQWKQPFRPADMSDRVEVEGDPSFTVEMNFGNGGEILSAIPAINGIPAVCEARPGLLGPLDVPRFWSRNVTGRG